jgi:hypothetical protein
MHLNNTDSLMESAGQCQDSKELRLLIMMVLSSLRLYQPRIGRDSVTDAWDNGYYDEGRSTRFPSGLNGPYSDERVYLKKSLDHTLL